MMKSVLLAAGVGAFTIPGIIPREFSYHDTLTIETSAVLTPEVSDDLVFGSGTLASSLDMMDAF
jgi:hypothetical protein